MAKPKKSDGQFYLLRNIPTEVWAAAKVKAEAFNPPVSLRWVIIELLRKWGKQPAAATDRQVDPPPMKTPKVPRVAKPKAPKVNSSLTDVSVVGATPLKPTTDAPDLGDSF